MDAAYLENSGRFNQLDWNTDYSGTFNILLSLGDFSSVAFYVRVR